MKKLTSSSWDEFGPCYDPRTVLGENWEGTLLDLLDMEQIKAKDRIWAATCILDDRTNRLFAVACAKEVQYLIQDERSIVVLKVAEAYANGLATEQELAAAWNAAKALARASARASAWNAAWNAAKASAWNAARASARDAARAAAWDAAMAAAWDAAMAAARDAARDAAKAEQIEILKTLIRENS